MEHRGRPGRTLLAVLDDRQRLGVHLGVRRGGPRRRSQPPVGDPSPTASVDAGTLSGTIYTVSGWAFDPNAPQQEMYVDVYDRRPDGSQVAVRLRTRGTRPDVAQSYPGTGQNTGFSGSLQLAGVGRHSVCVYAINVGAGANRLVQCRAVYLSVP